MCEPRNPNWKLYIYNSLMVILWWLQLHACVNRADWIPSGTDCRYYPVNGRSGHDRRQTGLCCYKSLSKASRVGRGWRRDGHGWTERYVECYRRRSDSQRRRHHWRPVVRSVVSNDRTQAEQFLWKTIALALVLADRSLLMVALQYCVRLSSVCNVCIVGKRCAEKLSEEAKKMAYGESNGHVTDDVTWPWKVKVIITTVHICLGTESSKDHLGAENLISKGQLNCLMGGGLTPLISRDTLHRDTFVFSTGVKPDVKWKSGSDGDSAAAAHCDKQTVDDIVTYPCSPRGSRFLSVPPPPTMPSTCNTAEPVPPTTDHRGGDSSCWRHQHVIRHPASCTLPHGRRPPNTRYHPLWDWIQHLRTLGRTVALCVY